MRFGSLQEALLVSALAAAASCASVPPTLAQDPPAAPGALRLCADPDNLPFSSDDPANPGIYNEIGDAIGRALGRPVVYVWYRTYFGKRAVRVTMLAKQCDTMIGLPDSDDFLGPKVIFSKPLFNLGYAIVAPKGQSYSSVEDLKGKRVAVQFETEPQNIVGPRDDIAAVTVLSPDEGMKVLAEGRADAAFLWAATAGYLNKTLYDGRFSMIEVDGPRLAWPAAIGYPKASAGLRDSIDAVLPEVSKGFPALLAKYGIGPEAPATNVAADRPARSRTPQSLSRRRSCPRRRPPRPLPPPRRRRRRPSRRAPAIRQARRRRDGRIRRRAAGGARHARTHRRGPGGVQRNLRPLPWSGRGSRRQENRSAPPDAALRRWRAQHVLENRP